MKKLTRPAKLMLKLEIVKELRSPDLDQVVGGDVTSTVKHPTTTFISLERC
jgi:hypothetical protein